MRLGHRYGNENRESPSLTGSAVRMAPATDLTGRERELATLSALVRQLREGHGEALVLRGAPGTGKSALLAVATGLAYEQETAVRSLTGVRAEAELPFAGLHRLLRPSLSLADQLPDQQRTTLRAAIGLTDLNKTEKIGTEIGKTELLQVGLATLALIDLWSADGGLLLVVDDAHWLDQPTCDVLSFCARRLTTTPALVLIGGRDPQPAPFDDLAELSLAGLREPAARALLNQVWPQLAPAIRERVIAAAEGNPLALVELPAAMPASAAGDCLATLPASAAGDGFAALPDQLPVTDRLTRVFAGPAVGLPAPTRTILLAAAADGQGAPAEILRAAQLATGTAADEPTGTTPDAATGTAADAPNGAVIGTAVTADALWPAVDAGLVELRPARLCYRHPVTRSAIYHNASPAERQAVHAALATVLAGQPDRRSWHLAAATIGPDEQVASALDQVATRAERRGAVTVAVTALRRAADLSEDAASQGARLLRAAELAFDSGHSELGPRLLDGALAHAAQALDLPAEQRTSLSWLRRRQAGAGWTVAARIGPFITMADRMRADGHPALAAEALYSAAMRCWLSNPDGQTRAAVTAAAERLDLPASEPIKLTVLAFADPVRARRVTTEVASRTPGQADPADPADPAGLFLIGSAATAVWSYDLAAGFLDLAVSGLREQGQRGLLAQALVAQAWTAVHLSRPRLARTAANEAARLARETGQHRWATEARLAQAAAAAEAGDFDTAQALSREAEAQVSTERDPVLALAQFVRGHGAVANRRYVEGGEHLRRILNPADPAHHAFIGAWGLADLVEASAHTGDQAAAARYLAELESLAQLTAGSLLVAEASYARPLVASDDEAEAYFKTALDQDLLNWPCLRGRLQLRYGGWLRRHRRIAESRGPLRAAVDNFSTLNFGGLTDCARQELRASGETSRHRTPDNWDQLTPRELQIAQLAADGMSNRQIGQRLYISHRTVGYHLHQIFPKLGISSRSQLHAAVLSLPGGIAL